MQRRPPRRNDADLGVQLEEMLAEVGRMKGYVETFSERVSDIEANVAKLQGDLDVRFQQNAANQAKTEEEKKRAVEEAQKKMKAIEAVKHRAWRLPSPRSPATAG